MPARNGYDRELVFDEAEFCARRHGQARLELDRNAMLISIARRHAGRCARAAASPADRLTFALGDRQLLPPLRAPVARADAPTVAAAALPRRRQTRQNAAWRLDR